MEPNKPKVIVIGLNKQQFEPEPFLITIPPIIELKECMYLNHHRGSHKRVLIPSNHKRTNKRK